MKIFLFITLWFIQYFPITRANIQPDITLVNCNVNVGQKLPYALTCGNIKTFEIEKWPEEWGTGALISYTKYPAVIIDGFVYPVPLSNERVQELEILQQSAVRSQKRQRAEMGAKNP